MSKHCCLKCLGNTVRKLCWLQKHDSYLIWSKSCFHVFLMHMDDMIQTVKTCHNKCLGNTVCCTDCRKTFHIVIIRRWVKNYLRYRYMFCSLLYCWLGMAKYTWSTPLLPLWCRCDLHSPFLSWVLCHKHGRSAVHLHQRRPEGSDPFLMG